MKSVCTQRFSGTYSVRMREDTDQKNSKYQHLLRSEDMFFPFMLYISLRYQGSGHFVALGCVIQPPSPKIKCLKFFVICWNVHAFHESKEAIIIDTIVE